MATSLGLHLPSLALEPATNTSNNKIALPNPAETTKKLKRLKTEMMHVKADARVDEPSDETDTEWPCNYCSKRFQKKKFLKNHHQKKHPENSLTLKKHFQCEDCTREFTSRKPFAKHRNKHLIEKEGTNLKVQILSSHIKPTVECEINGTDIEEMPGDAAELTEDVQKALENAKITADFDPEVAIAELK